MRKLVVCLLAVNAVLLAGRFVQDLSVVEGGTSAPASENGDLNGDGLRDLSDAVYMLNFLFKGGPFPVAIADSDEVLARLDALEASVSALQGLTPQQSEILGHMSIVDLPIDDDDPDPQRAKTVRFTGVNVQVVNGLGATNGYPEQPTSVEPEDIAVNGTGNLIVGYQELISGRPNRRWGSHNVVVGMRHEYWSFGGLVVGLQNRMFAPFASVSGGNFNTASGRASSVSGGYANAAEGHHASVSGGSSNLASGRESSVSGGLAGNAVNEWSSVSGGSFNFASGQASSVTGGRENVASGGLSSVTAGSLNTASGFRSSVNGGGG